LVYHFFISKIFRGYIFKRRSKIYERFIKTSGICYVITYPYIQVFCVAWLGIKSYGICANNKIFNLMLVLNRSL